MTKAWLLSVALASCSLTANSLDRSRVSHIEKKIRETANQKDWTSMRAALLELGAEMGQATPIYMLRMASVETHLGHTTEAVNWMSRYAATGLNYDVTKDDDLRPLTTNHRFIAVASKMEHSSRALSSAKEICSIPLKDMMPEDITFDSVHNSFVTTSVRHHGLYRVSLPLGHSGQCGFEPLPLDEDAKRWPSFAVSADHAHGLLWMTTAALRGFDGVTEADNGKTALFAIDERTGHIVKRFDLSNKNAGVLGDMCVAEDGTVYVTDSLGGGVYRVRGELNKAHLELIAEGLFSPQTPVLSSDSKHLFVADYSLGIAVIDLISLLDGKTRYLDHPDSIAVTGIDGLYRIGDSLIGIQNGTDPQRIMQFKLNHQQTAIVSAHVIEQAIPSRAEPTHAVMVHGVWYVSTNVGWGKVDNSGGLRAGAAFSAPIILLIPPPVLRRNSDRNRAGN